MDLLAQGQEKLGSQVFITPQAMDLYDQLSAMEWSETIENKIVNSKNYHLYDAFVYGCDRLPKFDLSMSIINRDSWLRQYDDAMQSIQKQPGKIMHGGKLRRRRW